MSKATEKIIDQLQELHPEYVFEINSIKVNKSISGKYSTEEVFFTVTAKQMTSFINYKTIYFYSHSPVCDCAKSGIITKYENYSYYIHSK